jgi:hypothetical protein
VYLILVIVALAIAISIEAVRRQRRSEWINRRGQELRQQQSPNREE